MEGGSSVRDSDSGLRHWQEGQREFDGDPIFS